jgi:hypothetical protein
MLSVLLPDGNGQLIRPAYGEQEFCADALSRFPQLTQVRKAGIHLTVTELAAAARSALAEGDRLHLEQLFSFFNDVVERIDADVEIRNAIQISFLTPDDFATRKGEEAWTYLPPGLKKLIQEAA